ncbi:MAG TPA: hypothetical protein VG454_00295, partial [Gemmatimonadales bacterium]|nr:hypothetical protein [Gemmatimonadales bacterium]
MRRALFSWILLLLAGFQRAPAQTADESTAHAAPSSSCYHARPRPACSSFVLTNFGTYVFFGNVTGPVPGLGQLRGVADWGWMANISARDAIGATMFA